VTDVRHRNEMFCTCLSRMLARREMGMRMERY